MPKNLIIITLAVLLAACAGIAIIGRAGAAHCRCGAARLAQRLRPHAHFLLGPGRWRELA